MEKDQPPATAPPKLYYGCTDCKNRYIDIRFYEAHLDRHLKDKEHQRPCEGTLALVVWWPASENELNLADFM
jgi:hypothetical protein